MAGTVPGTPSITSLPMAKSKGALTHTRLPCRYCGTEGVHGCLGQPVFRYTWIAGERQFTRHDRKAIRDWLKRDTPTKPTGR